MSNEMVADESDDEHFEELPDGAGCTEIWEHIAERRGRGDVESTEVDEE
ncbi:hypothetical protein [Halovivax limisalsi]|nr:hypothetical protein [Halovivax limisalsi]